MAGSRSANAGARQTNLQTIDSLPPPTRGQENDAAGERFAVTEIEFQLRTARAISAASPAKAIGFVLCALSLTVDARLRFLIAPALSALERNDAEAAKKWLDRACEYEQARRSR